MQIEDAQLTEAEREVLAYLKCAWESFMKLPTQHPMDEREMCDAIHRCQHLIGMRSARRVDPNFWYNKMDERE